VLATALLGLLGWLFIRAAKSYATEAVTASKSHTDSAVKEVTSKVDDVKYDLAKNYVTHSHLEKLERAQERTLRIVTQLQVQLARHFGFKSAEHQEEDIG
jgi:cell fate (sporulation/competence/biofilm development) regulator YmcA (YheA/YmcA/DUF963 family)